MNFMSDLLDSMDGNIIEYCILGGIVVLVIILIASIVSCIKSLGNKKDKKINYAKLPVEQQDDDLDVEPIESDPIKELLAEAKQEKKEDVLILEEDDEEEVSIASKIEIPEIIEEKEEIKKEIVVEQKEQKPMQKLDIKSITREMELKLEEEAISSVDAYEDEQEKTAIISYKELVEAAARIEANADKEEEYADDIVFEFNSKKMQDEKGTQVVENKAIKKTKFIPTLDISPVFGKRETYNIKNEDIYEIEEVNDSVDETNEKFLENLNNLRNNLN